MLYEGKHFYISGHSEVYQHNSHPLSSRLFAQKTPFSQPFYVFDLQTREARHNSLHTGK